MGRGKDSSGGKDRWVWRREGREVEEGAVHKGGRVMPRWGNLTTIRTLTNGWRVYV